jgi:LAS superfamily LD-carboxypeptidase LdcB
LNQLNDWEKVQAVLRWSAMPGASRHHWGTDIDIFDANAMTEGYQIQLTPEECEGQGLFAPMHQWLTGVFTNGEQNTYGFFQPYAKDKGGVAPERWHLSYKPIAKSYAEQLSKSMIRQKLSRDANLMYLDVVLDHLDEIFERFVQI